VAVRLLVTGAAGMLGQDVVRAAEGRGHDVSGLARGDLDITDAEAVTRAVTAVRPEAVVNCAAWTDVDGAESREAAALAVNGEGAGAVARAATEAGAFVVHVSTDYVFDGTAGAPYAEDAETNPLSAYGRTKLAGERAVAGAGDGHAIVRSSWLFGLAGPNFVETMLRLAGERDSVSVVCDQVGSPTWTGHLAPALVTLAEDRAAGVHHVAGAGAGSWNAFAAEIFRRAGVSCEVVPATTAEMSRPAPRPAFSVLGVTRPDTPRLPAWEDGLAAYLAAREAPVAGGRS